VWVFRFYGVVFGCFGGGNLGFWEVVFWGFLGILVERFGIGDGGFGVWVWEFRGFGA